MLQRIYNLREHREGPERWELQMVQAQDWQVSPSRSQAPWRTPAILGVEAGRLY